MSVDTDVEARVGQALFTGELPAHDQVERALGLLGLEHLGRLYVHDLQAPEKTGEVWELLAARGSAELNAIWPWLFSATARVLAGNRVDRPGTTPRVIRSRLPSD